MLANGIVEDCLVTATDGMQNRVGFGTPQPLAVVCRTRVLGVFLDAEGFFGNVDPVDGARDHGSGVVPHLVGGGTVNGFPGTGDCPPTDVRMASREGGSQGEGTNKGGSLHGSRLQKVSKARMPRRDGVERSDRRDPPGRQPWGGKA